MGKEARNDMGYGIFPGGVKELHEISLSGQGEGPGGGEGGGLILFAVDPPVSVLCRLKFMGWRLAAYVGDSSMRDISING